MKAIAGNRAALLVLAAKIDARLGYPKPGVDIGEGVHAPPEQSATLRHVDLRQHPTTRAWAYPVAGRLRRLIAALQAGRQPTAADASPDGDDDAAVVANEIDLGSDWDASTDVP